MDGKMKNTQVLVPTLIAATLLYSIVYHVMMFHTLSKNVTVDECAEAAHVGGMLPPQCLELETFRDWHRKEADELLNDVPGPKAEEEQSEAHADASIGTGDLPSGKAAIVVDGSGNTFADTISRDLAGLEKHYSELVVSGIHLDVKYDKDESKTEASQTLQVSSVAPMPWGKSLKDMQETVEHKIHDELDRLEEASPEHSTEKTGKRPSFEELHAQIEARHKRRTENRARLMKEIVHKMDTLDKSLLDVVSDRNAWESTLLEKHNATNAIQSGHQESAPANSQFMSKRLQWSVMPTVYHHKKKVSEFLEVTKRPQVIVSKTDVRHLHWMGKLPKVAAITWIKGDRKTKARMMYFVDNFKLQDYEGERELLLVYHHKDAAAAHIAHQYAAEANIKGVAAHDMSQEMFPSDPALRYAAWSSDAEVIAQWSFDEYHDPSRLSLQVKAMAHSNRKACVLSTMSTSHSQEDEENEISPVSLIGERSWMKEHWYPFSGKKSPIVETFKAGETVELDMQNKAMMSNISRIEHVFTETSTVSPTPATKDTEDAESASSPEGTDFSRGITECLNYDHSKGKADEDAAEKAIKESAGEEFSKKFHNLVKRRRDVVMKLQLLCFQTTMEKDAGKRKFMHDHVLEMDRIAVELEKHIKNTAAVFQPSGADAQS